MIRKKQYVGIILLMVLLVFHFFVPHQVYAEEETADIRIICDEAHGLFSSKVDGITLQGAVPGDSFERHMSLENHTQQPQQLYFKIKGADEDETFSKYMNLEVTYNNEVIYQDSLSKALEATFLGTYEQGDKGWMVIKLTFSTEARNEVAMKNIKAQFLFYAEELRFQNVPTASGKNTALGVFMLSTATLAIGVLYKKRRGERYEKG